MKNPRLRRLMQATLFAALVMVVAIPVVAAPVAQFNLADQQVAAVQTDATESTSPVPVFETCAIATATANAVPLLALSKTTDGRLLVAPDPTVFPEDIALLASTLVSASQSNTANSLPAEGYILVKDTGPQSDTWTAGDEFTFAGDQTTMATLKVMAVLPTATATYALMAINKDNGAYPLPQTVLVANHTGLSDGGMLYQVNTQYSTAPARVLVQNQNAAWTLVK